MRSASVRALLVAAAVLCLAGCSVTHHVTGPLPVRKPLANSPTAAIRLFEWGWNNRDFGACRSLLTDDFRFVFALGDSAGNQFRNDPFGREQMLNCLTLLFVGGGSAPPAKSIVLHLDPTLVVLPDSRDGKNAKWHKEIVTSVDLAILTEASTEFRVRGYARFFVVRGDSALIPADLGVGPDSTRWYLQQWNDETLAGGGALLWALPARPQPANNTTWGDILARYYEPPAAPRR